MAGREVDVAAWTKPYVDAINNADEATKALMPEQYLITKGGAYYRPNAEGYTRDIAEAGRFTFDEAVSHSLPNGPDGPRDGIRYEPAPAPTPVGERVEAVGSPANGDLAFLIEMRLLGVAPDSQTLVLEDHDWRRIIAALGASKHTTPTRQAIAAAYEAGATDCHNDWLHGHGERGARISEAALDYADAVLRVPVEVGRCPNCDGTGDVHRIDGEWLGECDCGAALATGGAK